MGSVSSGREPGIYSSPASGSDDSDERRALLASGADSRVGGRHGESGQAQSRANAALHQTILSRYLQSARRGGEPSEGKSILEVLKAAGERSSLPQLGCGLVVTASKDKSIKIFQVISS